MGVEGQNRPHVRDVTADEVRPAQFSPAEGDLDAEMVAIAGAIIRQRTGSFDPSRYRDRYQEALRELIEAKMKGLPGQAERDRGTAARIVLESKEARLAIRAKVTIDCTGDGDIFYRAGAVSDSDIDERDIHHCINTAWLFGGVDMPRWIAFKTGDPDGFKSFMERGRAPCGGLFERRSCRGATMSRCSWDRGWPAIRRSMSRTRPRSRSARTD